MVSFLFFAAALLPQVIEVLGHGRLTQPKARNGNENGLAAGGPTNVYDFYGNSKRTYAHGVCGNHAEDNVQTYNAVGDVQATYKSGSQAEFKVVITAHHMGFFEFELCMDAGQLSEDCFMQHRLLKAGCKCECENDNTNSCAACDKCRQWWKPLVEGEPTGGNELLILDGNTDTPYEFTMHYDIPEGLESKNAVLRWHYMTTNSCTSEDSMPEEFWNCADVKIKKSKRKRSLRGDDDDDEKLRKKNGKNRYDNDELKSMQVRDIANDVELTGVYSNCPVERWGDKDQYDCGTQESDGSYANCKDSFANGLSFSRSSARCSGKYITCEQDCSSTWFQCSENIAYRKPVPEGTKCKNNQFVVESECPASDNEEHATIETSAEPSAETTPSDDAEHATIETSAEPTETDCGTCTGCIWWENGVCYDNVDVTASYCKKWTGNVWCGPS